MAIIVIIVIIGAGYLHSSTTTTTALHQTPPFRAQLELHPNIGGTVAELEPALSLDQPWRQAISSRTRTLLTDAGGGV